jgi:hypothetical protein
MEGAGTLELLAELAVGVLGFSGIVAALARRAPGEWAPIDQRRFFSMVLIGALVVILALLPFPLHYAGLGTSSLWGWSSGLGAVLVVSVAVGVVRTSPGAGPLAMYRDPEVNNAALALGIVATYGSPLLLFLNAAGVLFDRAFAPYLVAVLLNFSVALVTFVRLLQALVGRGARAA